MNWTLDDSRLVYGIGRGDLKFLDISEDGELILKIDDGRIKFTDIIQKLSKEGINNSFTLRIPQLINYQINRLQQLFEHNMEKYKYKGIFKPLYPLKVNQKKLEVQAVVNASTIYGLEAGTRSEFILLMKIFKDQKYRLIMANGVKDNAYVTMIKNAINEGYKVFISAENIAEVKLVHDLIPKNDINLLLRIKPYVNVRGYWGSSSSRNSKFGLGIHNLIEVLLFIKKYNFDDRLIGIHAHPGSQIEKIEDLKNYIGFMINTYSEISKRNFKGMRIIDFGGGLPIDYDSRLNKDSMAEYVETIISEIVKSDIKKHPNIMIESGRAVTALSSLIAVQPIDIHNVYPDRRNKEIKVAEEILNNIKVYDSIEKFEELINQWDEIAEHFMDNFERLHDYEYYSGLIKNEIRKKIVDLGIEKPLKDIFNANYYLYGNFSLFNSAADHVLVNQYFPLFTTKDLHTKPETIMRLVDISCDSDGEISVYQCKKNDKILITKDNFPLTGDIKLKGFPIGSLYNLKNSYVIIPLVGAYQDIIEANHNLIGDLADGIIYYHKNSGWQIELLKEAQSIEDIVKELGYTIKADADPYVNF